MAAESVFDQDDDGIVVLLQDDPDASLESVVRRAASLCPSHAIKLSE
jgi:ferredoxin